MKETRSKRNRVWTWSVCGALAVIAALSLASWRAHKRQANGGPFSETTSSATAPEIIPQSSPTKILTKDPEYSRFATEPNEQDLLLYSPEYQEKAKQIDAQVSTLKDPDLRQRQIDADWSSTDKQSYVESGKRHFLQARMAYFQNHRDGWFEIGHLDYGNDNQLSITSDAASPLSVSEGTRIPFPLKSMDDVYSRFDTVAGTSPEARVSNGEANWSCVQQLLKACEDLGGSMEGCRSSERIAAVEHQGESCSETLDEAQKDVRDHARGQRLVLVGQGDVVAHRVERLLLVDYDTETVLAELPGKSLPIEKVAWRFDSPRLRSDDEPQVAPAVVTTGTTDVLPAQAFSPSTEAEVSSAVEVWREAQLTNDPVLQSRAYASSMDRYFLSSGWSNEQLEKYLAKWDAKSGFSQLEIQDLVLRPLEAGAVEASFTKRLTVSRNGVPTTAVVKAVLHFIQENGAWKVNYERDFKS